MDGSASRPTHIFISCGEASGERYALALVDALRELEPGLRFSAMGGEALARAGIGIVTPNTGLSVMGFSGILPALGRIREARGRILKHLSGGDVDLFIPIDFPGFNVGLARRARSSGCPVYYMIAPQLWAWGAWRIGGLRKAVDRLGAVLPFEPDYFGGRGIETVHFGHPLLDDYPEHRCEQELMLRERRISDPDRPLRLGLFPGSRPQEVSALREIFLDASRSLDAGLEGRRVETILSRAAGLPSPPPGIDGCEISRKPLPELLPEIDLALVCSGTASLELALANVPHVVAYRTSALNYALARRLVKVEHIALSNLILSRPLVREFIQGEATAARLRSALLDLGTNAPERARLQAGFSELRKRFGPGEFWKRTAEDVLHFVHERRRT